MLASQGKQQRKLIKITNQKNCFNFETPKNPAKYKSFTPFSTTESRNILGNKLKQHESGYREQFIPNKVPPLLYLDTSKESFTPFKTILDTHGDWKNFSKNHTDLDESDLFLM